MSFTLLIILFLSGIIVGFINTLSAGGTTLSIALFLALGLPIESVNSTNRIGVLIQSFSASLMMRKKHLINYNKILLLTLPTIFGAIFGAILASYITSSLFSLLFAGVLLLTLVFMFINPKTLYKEDEEKTKKKYTLIHYLVFFFIGIYGGFIQVGTGYFLIAAGTLLLGYDLIQTNAIKVTIMFFYTLVAMVVFFFEGNINWTFGLLHAAGGALGAYLATLFAIKKGAKFIRWLIIFVIIVTALNLLGIINLKEIMSNFVKVL
ncbi:MAG: sulfite exporter TauE/SafE family protein [Bacteroidales bacterium]|jgi:uncharacterized membrane protein YfcA|nr:sulfite exporter TauE/SafE family protein [Bacteroidales bacterium]